MYKPLNRNILSDVELIDDDLVLPAINSSIELIQIWISDNVTA